MEKEENLQTDKRSPRVQTERVTAQIVRIAKDKLQLTVEQSPIVQWIQKQLKCNTQKQQTEEQKIAGHRGWHL